MVQYSSGEVSSAVVSLIQNKLGVMDDYILMCTGDYQYECLIRNRVTKKIRHITVYRSGSGSSYRYVVAEEESEDFAYTVTAEYYVYSNLGIGRGFSPLVYDGIKTYSLAGICCALFLAIIFKGALYPCLRRSRQKRSLY